MNPPVEAFIKVIEKGSAEQYIILPNNKNIILAAEQVKKLLGAAQVDYVPTTNLAQGLAALLHFDAAKTLQENSAVMRREAKEAHSAAVSIAVRDSVVNGITVKKGSTLVCWKIRSFMPEQLWKKSRRKLSSWPAATGN